jgi:tetratricopeptide (TPR) repeat protein
MRKAVELRTSLAALLLLASGGPALAQGGPASPEPADHAMDAPAAASVSQGNSEHHGHADTLAPRQATLLTGYGDGGFAITTSVPQAQAFFSNGLELGAAFAHKAAVAAMEEAVRLDPACAMCLWGQALVTAPTINFGADEKQRAELLPLARRARARAAKTGTAKEKELTAALVSRFRPGDPARRDAAYAKAMDAVRLAFPADNEIAVLSADATMVAAFAQGSDPDLARLRSAIPVLETVLARAPDHTPAIHFYIHATEILGEPAKAEPYADKLAALAPRASHLVHMPAHTFYWLGRYQETAETNRRAVEIGKENAARLGLDGPDGVFGLPYHAHNIIYGLGGALMAGDSAVALDLARPLVARAATQDDASPVSQLLAASGYFAVARFDPASVAALPEPKLPYLRAAWNYARGEAAAWSGDSAALDAAIAVIPERIADQPDGDEVRAAETMLGVTRAVHAGRAATLAGDSKAAIAAFTRGAELEETPAFGEFTDPPAFWYPVRRDVAAALLASGDAAGAKAAAEASLKLRMKDPVAEALLARAQAQMGAEPAIAAN